MSTTKILYISYDGISDPLGGSQILPYLKQLVHEGIDIFLLSFEKRIDRREEIKKEFSSFNINWIPAKYHKGSFWLKIYDLSLGICLTGMAIYKNRIKIVHSRGYFPAFIALCLKNIFSLKFVFDVRGLWIDEKADAGVWQREGLRYKIGKWFEKRLLLSADEIIVLTQALKDKLERLSFLRDRFNSITVNPTCVDLKLFYPANGFKKVNALFKDRFVVSYFGSIGTFYNFFAVLDFYKVLTARFKNAYLLVMSNTPIRSTEEIIRKSGIPSERYYLDSVPYEEVPKWLRQSDASIIFYNRYYSREGCCPTKLGESLACGVPVIINDGIGDCSLIVKERCVGIIVKDFTESSYISATRELQGFLKDKEALSKRCRAVAEEFFSLDEGVRRYLEIYKRL